MLQVALIAVGGAFGAVVQALVVSRFGGLWGGATLAAVSCTLFGAVWALSDPNSSAHWALVDRATVAPLMYGLLAAAAPLSAVLGVAPPRSATSERRVRAQPARVILGSIAVLIIAAAAMMLGYLAIRGSYALHRQLTLG